MCVRTNHLNKETLDRINGQTRGFDEGWRPEEIYWSNRGEESLYVMVT